MPVRLVAARPVVGVRQIRSCGEELEVEVAPAELTEERLGAGSVRASEQRVVEYEEWDDLLEALGGGFERRIVVNPQVAAEENDCDAHQ